MVTQGYISIIQVYVSKHNQPIDNDKDSQKEDEQQVSKQEEVHRRRKNFEELSSASGRRVHKEVIILILLRGWVAGRSPKIQDLPISGDITLVRPTYQGM